MTWPNVLVTDYMETTNQITPELQMKAESLINAGYQLLLTYEHPGGGFSWFGTQDGHPYLTVTAIGLLEFTDMARVFPVDEAMVARTRQWLVGQQQADGSWPGDISELFPFQSSTLRNTALCTWALAYSGETSNAVDKGLAYLGQHLDIAQEDNYTLGTALAAFAAGAPASSTAQAIVDELKKRAQQDDDGVFWPLGDTPTAFYGGGVSGDVETTALIVRALLELQAGASMTSKAIDWLLAHKDANGNFGSTQATIWTLRALVAAASMGTEGATGNVVVEVDGQQQATVPLEADQWDVMKTIDLSDLATPGEHTVRLEFAGTGRLSWSLVARHHIPWDLVPPDDTASVAVNLSYDKTKLALNDTAEATLQVRNRTQLPLNMVVVTLGIPPGFTVETADLQPYIDAGDLSKVETTGKQLNLYILELPPAAERTYTWRVRATMPVKASDGGGKVWLYYSPDDKASIAATELEATE